MKKLQIKHKHEMPIYRDIYFLFKNFDHSEYLTGMDTSTCEHGCDERKTLS